MAESVYQFPLSVCGLILVVFVLSELISAGLKTLFTPEYFTFLRRLSVTMMLTLQRANTVNNNKDSPKSPPL